MQINDTLNEVKNKKKCFRNCNEIKKSVKKKNDEKKTIVIFFVIVSFSNFKNQMKIFSYC